MSASVPPPVPPPAVTPTEWSVPLVSLFTLGLMVVGLAVAYLTRNQEALTLMLGAIVANATTVVNFFMGSSSGSQKKDVTIAGQLTPPPPAAPTPAAVVVAPPPPPPAPISGILQP